MKWNYPLVERNAFKRCFHISTCTVDGLRVVMFCWEMGNKIQKRDGVLSGSWRYVWQVGNFRSNCSTSRRCQHEFWSTSADCMCSFMVGPAFRSRIVIFCLLKPLCPLVFLFYLGALLSLALDDWKCLFRPVSRMTCLLEMRIRVTNTVHPQHTSLLS